MGVRHLKEAELATLVPRIAKHLYSLELEAQLIGPEHKEDHQEAIFKPFRAGIPKDSTIYVNDDLTNWIWLKKGEKNEILDYFIDSNEEVWIDILSKETQGNPFEFAVYTRESQRFTALLNYRLMAVHVSLDPKKTPEHHHPRGILGFHSMSGRDYRQFITDIARKRAERLSTLSTSPRDVDILYSHFLAKINEQLPDGYSTNSQHFLTAFYDNTPIADVWYDMDSSSSWIYGFEMRKGVEDDSLQKYALSSLITWLRNAWMKRIEYIAVTPEDRTAELLLDLGFSVADYHCLTVGKASTEELVSFHLDLFDFRW